MCHTYWFNLLRFRIGLYLSGVILGFGTAKYELTYPAHLMHHFFLKKTMNFIVKYLDGFRKHGEIVSNPLLRYFLVSDRFVA